MCISLSTRSPLLLSLPFLLRISLSSSIHFILPISLCYQDTQVQSLGRKILWEETSPLQYCCLKGSPPGYSPWSLKSIGHNWASNTSLSTSVTCLSKLPTYIYPSIVHISNHVFLSFLPSIHPSSILIKLPHYYIIIFTCISAFITPSPFYSLKSDWTHPTCMVPGGPSISLERFHHISSETITHMETAFLPSIYHPSSAGSRYSNHILFILFIWGHASITQCTTYAYHFLNNLL